MKNWKVILWLLLFFPVGLYFMFKHTEWPKAAKLGITVFFGLFAGIIVSALTLVDIIFLSGFTLTFTGIIHILYSLIRKTNRRKGMGILFAGIIMLAFSFPTIEAQQAEQLAIEQQQQAEQERIAEEKRQEEVARQKEEERIEKEKQLKLDVLAAIESAEEEPLRKNYDKASALYESLAEPDTELENRLLAIEPVVIEYEEALASAEEAFETARESKSRDTYDTAYELAAALSIPNDRLNDRLASLDEEITEVEKAEEERIAKEKEAEEKRIAAEKEAEEKRIAQEKAEEEQRIAAEKAAQEKAEKEAAAASEEKASSQQSGSSNNSSQSNAKASSPAPSTSSAGTYVDSQGNGLIKGSKSGIYHVPGSTYYDRTTNPVRMFKTIEEAKAAGYRAPKR